jgi:hypothetical protein
MQIKYRVILLSSFITFLLSCNNSNDKSTVDLPEDSIEVVEDLSPEERLIWISDYDTAKGEFFLKQQRTVNTDTLKAENVITDINAAWENIKLVYQKISNDTLYVAIPESDYLTQRMGSTGASGYMAAATYSLTEIKGVKFVHYNFEEGDHLSPGTFSRDDFKNFR